MRDCLKSDIADEIRWFKEETAWIKADTPWESVVPIDEQELKNQVLDVISSTRPADLRSRLEIETQGKHIGFVCSYPLDYNFEPIQYGKAEGNAKKYCALGIEICEPAFWGKGLGRQVLAATIRYYQDNGFNDFYLETWSGNTRMLKCAQKLGFYICKQIPAFRQASGIDYDAVILLLDGNKFKEYY